MNLEVTLVDVEATGFTATVSDPLVPGANHYPDVPLEWLTTHRRHLADAQESRPRVVFLGDSITQGWGSEGLGSWDASFAPMGAANYGMGGDKVQNLLWRLDQGLLSGFSPNVIVVMIGVNNLWFDADEYGIDPVAEGVLRIGQRLRRDHPNAVIFQMSVLPALEDPNHVVRQHVSDLNARVASRVGDYGASYVEVGTLFEDEMNSLDPAIMPDFVHLSPVGYQKIEFVLGPLVRSAVAERL